MNLSKFTSIAIQAINQLDLVNASKDLKIIVKNMSNDAGIRRNIRVRRS